MQTTQIIFSFTDIEVLYIFLDKNWKLDISHAFLPLTVTKFSSSQNSPVFWPVLYIVPLVVHKPTVRYFSSYRPYQMGCTLTPPGEYERTIGERWRCSFMSNCFEYLFSYFCYRPF